MLKEIWKLSIRIIERGLSPFFCSSQATETLRIRLETDRISRATGPGRKNPEGRFDDNGRREWFTVLPDKEESNK